MHMKEALIEGILCKGVNTYHAVIYQREILALSLSATKQIMSYQVPMIKSCISYLGICKTGCELRSVTPPPLYFMLSVTGKLTRSSVIAFLIGEWLRTPIL